MTAEFLPLTMDELRQQGREEVDFLLVTGDAYVDHPSFGAALIGRLLEACGYSVGVAAQPDPKNPQDLQVFGRPRLACLITGGNMDSMVSNYTSAGKPRRRDVFSPGGVGGARPDRAVIAYCNLARQAFKKIPLIIGGIEASLRRFSHYDYWSDKIRHSILQDSKADVLIYGMGEYALTETARRLEEQRPLAGIRGTAINRSSAADCRDAIFLPSHGEVVRDGTAYCRAVMLQQENCNPQDGATLVQPDGARFIIQYAPAPLLSQAELDRIYALPFARRAHPAYDAQGGVPAAQEVQFSVTGARGCFGGCSFCAITSHQGRTIRSRSHESILSEIRSFADHPDFRGIVHDIGGPTANFRIPACRKQPEQAPCPQRHCLFPGPCPNLQVDHSDLRRLLAAVRQMDHVRRVFIRSGIRYDYLMADSDEGFFRDLVAHHVSGRIKVAPEHSVPSVLSCMGKPGIELFEAFCRRFKELSRKAGKKQYIVPYFISSHPGSSLKEAVELACYMKNAGLRVDQVQDFLPTPGTLSTAMYCTGRDPRTLAPVYVERSGRNKRLQRALLQFDRPENFSLVREALVKAGRKDLIGFGRSCLVRPGKKVSSSGRRGRGKRDGTKRRNPGRRS
ncbi:MAG: YgiQ family radical SAM protein [Fibrobacterota bacterium]